MIKTTTNGSSIQSVIKTFSIIEILSKYEKGLNIKELEDLSGMHKSSIYRILYTLMEIRYITKTIEGSYRLTLKVLGLGNKLLNDINVIDIAKPYVMEISLKTNETTHFVMFDNNEAVYLDVIHPTNSSFRANSYIGKRAPLYVTAVGKLYLADHTDEQIAQIWEETKDNIIQFTDKTITTLEKMMEVIEEVRENGYALDDGEHEPGVFCIGIPLKAHDGSIKNAISVTFPKEKMNIELFNNTIKLLKEYSNKISKEFGYRG